VSEPKAERGAANWPPIVWTAPVLRGLDARGRAEIEAAGALLRLGEGEVLFRPGEPADSFYVVAEGRVSVRAVRRGEVDATVIREISEGESFGEEGTLRAGGTRHMEASALTTSRLAAVPLTMFRRAMDRLPGGTEIALRQERTLRRAATRDLLSTMSFTRSLPAREVEVLLDAVEHVQLARGEPLYRENDPPNCVYFVAEGMLQVQTEDLGRIHVRAYVTRGDVLGDAEVESGERRATSAVASGPAWVLSVPRAAFLAVARKNSALLTSIRRIRQEHEDAQERAVGSSLTTRHVFKDLYRMQVARSLLVIDESSCVRCGHCAWSCAAAHADGVSRLVRRGDKIVTRARTTADDVMHAAPLLVPNSCQHCENPACMLDCPTGAIGRDPRGEVFIREDLCTGCGNCAKGCPWDNILMAPRAGGTGVAQVPALKSSPGRSPEVAVKCDLCHGIAEGPRCVASCPTEAIARVNPSDAFPEVGLALGKKARAVPLPKPQAGWPWIAAGIPVSLGFVFVRATTRTSFLVTGGALATIVALLAGYAFVKRIRRPRLRPWFIAHIALGVLAVGAVVAHAGGRIPPNIAGALHLAFWGAAITGIFGAIAFRVLPSWLSRIEHAGALPEDLRGRKDEIDRVTFTELTGKSEIVKTLFARVLRPYAHRTVGPLALTLSGRSLGEERRRLRAQIDRILGGRAQDKLAGVEALVRLAVERRAIPAQRVLQALLRGWLPVHVIFTAIALVLLVVHAVLATRYR
jgi:Fe-S-cluster-containing dehydrogenase component/CRP-like cAMP-binding protein